MHACTLQAYSRMTARGYEIGNVDVTLILQRPKVRDLKPAMAENIARLLRTPVNRVNVKARTHEDVDSVGEGRAMETHVVLTLLLKSDDAEA
jgi:2-C-methyl-D-erythritol 2,4-cyclodiphosphate synthase